MVDVEIKIDMEDLFRELRKLPWDMKKNIVVGATRAACNPIIEEARSRIHDKTGNLGKSIGKKKHRDKGTFVKFSIGARKGGNFAGYHAHLVEFGHSAVVGGKKKDGGKVVGFVSPKPFMRPAFEVAGKKSIEAFAEYVKKRLAKGYKK